MYHKLKLKLTSSTAYSEAYLDYLKTIFSEKQPFRIQHLESSLYDSLRST